MTMTDPTAPTPSPQPPPVGGQPGSPKRLRRSTTDRLGGGVAGGLGEYTGLDPVLFRVLFVALAFFGGSGIVLYLIGWLVIPDADAKSSRFENIVSSARNRQLLFVAGVAALCATLWLFALASWNPVPLFPTVAVVVALIFLLRHRNQANTQSTAVAAPPPPPAAASSVALVESTATDTPTTDGPAAAGPWASATDTATDQPTTVFFESSGAGQPAPTVALPPAPLPVIEPKRSKAGAVIGTATAIALAVVWGVLAAVSAGTPVPVQAFLWTAFGILLGGMLLTIAFRRPQWWMLAIVVPVTAAIVIVGAARVRVGDPVGQHSSAPTVASELDDSYVFSAGDFELDLRSLDLTTDRTVQVSMGAGRLVVRLPKDLDVKVDANARLGEIEALGKKSDGWRAERSLADNGSDGSSGPVLTLDLSLVTGRIEVTR